MIIPPRSFSFKVVIIGKIRTKFWSITICFEVSFISFRATTFQQISESVTNLVGPVNALVLYWTQTGRISYKLLAELVHIAQSATSDLNYSTPTTIACLLLFAAEQQ